MSNAKRDRSLNEANLEADLQKQQASSSNKKFFVISRTECEKSTNRIENLLVNFVDGSKRILKIQKSPVKAFKFQSIEISEEKFEINLDIELAKAEKNKSLRIKLK